MRHAFALALLLSLPLACRPTAHPARTPGVEVIADRAQVAEALRLAEERRATRLSELLEHPEWILTWDTEAIEVVKANRAVATARLQALRDERGAPADKRLHAILALRSLDVPPALPEMLALADAGPEAAQVLLGAVDDLYPGGTSLPPALGSRLASWVESPDPKLRAASVRIAGTYRIAAAADAVLRQLDATAKPGPGLLEAAARLRPSAELLARLEQRLVSAESPVGGSGLGAVAALGEAADENLRRRAAEVVVAYLAGQPNQPFIDGGTTTAIGMIAKVKPEADARALLLKVVNGTKWKMAASSALQELHGLDPAGAAELAAKAGLSLEGGGRGTSGPKLPSPSECAAILVEAGVLTRAEADAALAKAAKDSDPADPTTGGAEGVLAAAGRLVAFDVETGTVPNRHDLLLAEFAAASAGRFLPEAALEDYKTETPDAETGTYVVQFVHSGKLYHFHPEDLGDWYDVAAIVAAVHKALADANVGERFVDLDTGDQTAALVFAEPAALKKVSARLGLVLGEDLDASRKAGKAFEDKVRESLGK